MFLECRHILPNGLKCQALALRGKAYCYHHMRVHLYRARPAPAKNAPLSLPVLEDRSAIQIALALVVEAFDARRLDQNRARVFLSAIRLASQNVERRTDIISVRAVHSMTTTAAGDELGPAVLSCPPLTDCSECDIRDTCKERAAKEREDAEEEDEA